MRLLGIRDDLAANAYATATYLPEHNARFTVAPASAVDHHRPRDPHRHDDDVFCLETTRVVGQDYVVQYKSQGLQLDRAARGRVPTKSAVLVRETEDGRIRVIHVGRDGHERLCAWTPAVARAVARPALVATAPAAIMPADAPPHRPAPDHPWRAQHQRWVDAAAQRRAPVRPHP